MGDDKIHLIDYWLEYYKLVHFHLESFPALGVVCSMTLLEYNLSKTILGEKLYEFWIVKGLNELVKLSGSDAYETFFHLNLF